MVKIKPFCGIRPPKQYASEVASRPYDVLNSAEAKAEEAAVEVAEKAEEAAAENAEAAEVETADAKEEEAIYEMGIRNFYAQQEKLKAFMK